MHHVSYRGDAHIDGVPGTHAAVPPMFRNIAGSMCGALLPTGNAVDVIDGVACTLIDNGMPCVILRASEMGITGAETRDALDGKSDLKAGIGSIRLQAGQMMTLDDVTEKSVPKMILVAPPQAGGTISTRSFISHRCHATIGVFAAITAATACILDGSSAASVAVLPESSTFAIEHPTGAADVLMERDTAGAAVSAGTVRTASKLFDGRVFPRT